MNTPPENSSVRSISERTRLGISLSAGAVIVGAIVSGAWVVARYTASQEMTSTGLRAQMEGMGKKMDRMEDQMSSVVNRMTSIEYAVKEVKEMSERRRR